MAANGLTETKKALAALSPATPSAARAFRQALPSLSILVGDKIVVESEYCDEQCPPEKLRAIKESCEFLGGLLAACFELGLYEPLAEEVGWYASLMKNRGFGEGHVRDTVVAWINGIYFKIAPPASAELSRPLELLLDDLPALPAARPPEVPTPPAARRFLELILDANKRGAADYVLDLLKKSTPLEEIIDYVLLPALGEVGTLWQYNRIGVAEEHAAAEICRDVVGRLPAAAPAGERGRRKALLCCVPGEEHEL
ncbi:MAG TPA: B12-binding domain-containing protein, partial [bacterium]|nr:B12-binding domain-containing protein [bacterium]